jgi:hypothetical protein
VTDGDSVVCQLVGADTVPADEGANDQRNVPTVGLAAFNCVDNPHAVLGLVVVILACDGEGVTTMRIESLFAVQVPPF